MSEMSASENIVSLSVNGDAAEVKSAIQTALQQKVMVTLENKKKEVASAFIHPKATEEPAQEPEASTEEVENGWCSNKSKIIRHRNKNSI